MYDDILTSEKTDVIKQCANCEKASYILSNYSDKVFCQEKKQHMEKAMVCRLWDERMTGGDCYGVCFGI
jgi:hypothetical protein